MAFTVPNDQSTQIPADNHIGICCGVIDLGTHQESYQGGPKKTVHKMKIQFELPQVHRDDDKSSIISKTFNVSLFPKASLRIALDSWLGVNWPERFRGQSWDFLLGMPAMVSVSVGQSKRDPTRTATWIAGLGKVPKGLTVPGPNERCYEPFYLDLADCHLPKNLGVYDAEKIRSSKEYRSATFVDEAPKPQIGQVATASVGTDDDDDIPW